MNAFARRGACPALSAPMMTGDGLLVRLNPVASGLPPKTLIGLCESASRQGNGIVEVTARGSFQIRGLTPESADRLAGEVNALGIEVRTGVPVETAPLAGLDHAEIIDPRPLADAIRAAIVAAGLTHRLGPKVSVVVDGGGYAGMDDVLADVRLAAVRPGVWRMAIGGDAAGALVLGNCEERVAASAAVSVLEAIAGLGIEGRARDLANVDIDRLRPTLPGNLSIGAPLPLRDSRFALPLALPFGSIEATKLIEFLAMAREAGANEIRLAPRRMLLLLVSSGEAARAIRDIAASNGLITSPSDPRLHIAACPGAPACTSGKLATRELAARAALDARSMLGSLTLHISGCAKGCAHPRPAAITVVGGEDGAGLVVNGTAGHAPLAYTPVPHTPAAIARLSALLQRERLPDETAAECLARLSPARIAEMIEG